MSTKKVEVDPMLMEATKARDNAVKARARAKHSAATVTVATENLAAAAATAAKHNLEAEEAEKTALEYARKVQKSLEDSLGVTSQDEHHEEPAEQKRTATNKKV